MPEAYTNTISGLLRKRSELMGDAQRLREQLAHVGNDIEALDRTLIALGYQGDLKGVQPRGNRIVFFARDELRRFLLEMHIERAFEGRGNEARNPSLEAMTRHARMLHGEQCHEREIDYNRDQRRRRCSTTCVDRRVDPWRGAAR
jgi:hypothetical protein